MLNVYLGEMDQAIYYPPHTLTISTKMSGSQISYL